MRIYVSADMEGVAGIAHPHQVTFGPGVDRVDYDTSRGLMAAEANAAIEAAFEAGVAEVVVNDSHWQMRNLRAEDLDARAGHASGVIAHTYSSATVMEVRVNGEPHNEAALNAIRLGHFGIPVILASGDDALAGEVERLLPWAERVVVKRGIGYSTADSLSPAEARAAIGAGMRTALGRMSEMKPYRPSGPLAGEVDFRFPVHAAFAAVLPDIERIGPRTVGFGAPDGDRFYRLFVAAFRLAGVA